MEIYYWTDLFHWFFVDFGKKFTGQFKIKIQTISPSINFRNQQECIPVACVPPAAVAVMGESPHPPEQALPLEQAPPWSRYSPGVGLETPRPDPLNFPLGCWPRNLQGMLGYPPWRPAARHAGILPVWTEWLTDRCKNITFANFVWGCNKWLHIAMLAFRECHYVGELGTSSSRCAEKNATSDITKKFYITF